MPLVGALARFLGVEIVGQHLVGSAAQHANDQPPLGHVVEHRHFLGEQHRVALRHDRPEQRVLMLCTWEAM